ncbi:2-amino-4-hydroxy-6-hydroxymethyldihydropteridine pyrophosphokinase [Smithella sp. ME-1]|uniref:2-amino-4-hydroxy-6-hydroxymethyldihydropteridine diphosphokinase n=1 Tax=hydrocarbon metagenome TaxID=938273 RepID=A0A0W8FTL3_9ZZZZ|nr:2-amino-4-hydroxy-6-hydroxymethyldihydropteridine pyrophosphokinase [Smithella sp. ME-1]
MNGIICYIGIGSNLGNALKNCRDAVESLFRIREINVMRISSFYETEPVGIENQNYFVNAVVEIRTSLPARNLLLELQNIERKMGRKREVKGGPRIIDLDLLFYGHDLIQEADLTVPHPEMHKRRFVLEPLCELTSYLIHPVFCVSIRGLKERLIDNKIIRMIEKKNQP